MTDTPDLSALLAVADAATPGRWYWHPYSNGGMTLALPNEPYHELNVLKTTDDWPPNQADAEFIATFNPVTVRNLIVRLTQRASDAEWFAEQWKKALHNLSDRDREHMQKIAAERDAFGSRLAEVEEQRDLYKLELDAADAVIERITALADEWDRDTAESSEWLAALLWGAHELRRALRPDENGDTDD